MTSNSIKEQRICTKLSATQKRPSTITHKMYTNTVHEGEGLILSETASSTWVCTCFSTERVKSCCTYTGNTSQPQATQQERCPDLCGVAPCARLKPHHRTLATVTHVKRTGAVLNCVLLQSLFQTVHCCSHCSKLCAVAVSHSAD